MLIVSGSNPTPIVAGQTPPTWLHGQFTTDSDVEMVPYIAGARPIAGSAHLGPSVADGVTNTLAMQSTALAGGIPLTIMGTSQGALVIDQVIAADVAAGVSPGAVRLDHGCSLRASVDVIASLMVTCVRAGVQSRRLPEFSCCTGTGGPT